MTKMDRKLFAAKQPHEVKYIQRKWPNVFPEEVVLKIAKKAGRSRVKLYQALLDWAFNNIY